MEKFTSKICHFFVSKKSLIKPNRLVFNINQPTGAESAKEQPKTPDQIRQEGAAARLALINQSGTLDLNPLPQIPGKSPDPKNETPTDKTKIPERKEEFKTGKQFIESLKNLSPQEKEAKIQEELKKGNIPDFLRGFEEVEVKGPNGLKGKVRVKRDYLAIGSNDDWVRIPMNGLTAQEIAESFGCVLPTKKLVDNIYDYARRQGEFLPFIAAPTIARNVIDPVTGRNVGATWNNNLYGNYEARWMLSPEFIEAQQALYNKRQTWNGLVAGHKKDVIYSNTLTGRAARLEIHGAWNASGTIVQPGLSGGHHEATYEDYSHGIRLIDATMTVIHPDGRQEEMKVADVLQDPTLAPLLSDEGIMDVYSMYRPGQKAKLATTKKAEPLGQVAGVTIMPGGTRITPSKITVPQITEPESATPRSTTTSPKPATKQEKAEETIPKIRSTVTDPDRAARRRAALLTRPLTGSRVRTPVLKTRPKPAPRSQPQFSNPVPELNPSPSPSEPQRESAKEAPIPTSTYSYIGDSYTDGYSKFLEGKKARPFYHSEMTGEYTSWMKNNAPQMIDSLSQRPNSVFVVMGGVNDLVGPPFPLNSDENRDKLIQMITDNLSTIYQMARSKNVKVVAATIPPLWDAFTSRYSDPIVKQRHLFAWKKVNDFIVNQEGTGSGPNKVVYLDDTMADPENNWRLHPEYRQKDPLHPNQRGYEFMAPEIQEAVYELQNPGTQTKSQPSESLSGKIADFETNPYLNEQVTAYYFPPGEKDAARIHVNAPSKEKFDPNKKTRVILYALPNQSSIEQTVGSKNPGLHQTKDGWKFDIQQIGAQTRFLRENNRDENIVIVYMETPQKSWPLWRKGRQGRGAILDKLFKDVKTKLNVENADLSLSSHSGGGSINFSYLTEIEKIPDSVKRISFLESQYSYTSEHGKKIIDWLQSGSDRHFTAICYDDRQVAGGGTYEKTLQMITDFGFKETDAKKENGYIKYSKQIGQGTVNILISDGKKMHSEVVRRNGFIYSETSGSKHETVRGQFNDTQGYSALIQPT